MLPGSRSRVTLTLRQLWWGMLSALVGIVVVTPFLGAEAALIAACNVVLVTVALFEAEYRAYVRVSAHARLALLTAAAASALLTFGASVGLMAATLRTAGVAGGLSAAATILSIVILGRVFALFRRRDRVIVVN
jgi:O-antigen/teichoic acid export membrane protein